MAKDPEKYADSGVKLPRGALRHGVRGGKTLMAFALVGRDTPVFEEIAELRRASAA